MPKLTWMNKKKPDVNYLEALLKAYKTSRNITSEQLAEMLNYEPSTVRCQMRKPAKEWKIGMLMRYCDVLGIPYAEAFEAAAK